jgi:uncharacterized protein
MQYRSFGKLDIKLSALGFGAMRLPVSNGAIDEKKAINMLRYAIDKGLNYIDTAYIYHEGQSERLIGKAIKNGYRDKVHLATKLPSWKVKSSSDFDRFLDEQLNRLEVDYLDFYLLHALDKKEWPKLRDLGIIEWAEKTIAEGRFRYLGFSFHDENKVFKEIVDAYDWAMCLIQYNYMDIYNQAGIEGLRYAAERGIGVAVMEPLLGGRLAEPTPVVQAEVWDKAPVNRTPVEWALHWLWNQPEVSTVLSGMSTMEQVKENIAYASASGIGKLKPDEMALFDQARAAHESLTAIPCTKCNYCMPCPFKVDIPENICNYNDAGMYDRLEASRDKYNSWKADAEKTEGKTNDIRAACCTGCEECEVKCPQGIPISQWMPVIHEVMAEEKPFKKRLGKQGR